MFTVTDEDSTLSEKSTLEDAIRYAWAATNHCNEMSDSDMAFYTEQFEKTGQVQMSYGFYVVSVQAI